MEAREARRPPLQGKSNSDPLDFSRIALAAALLDYEEDPSNLPYQPSSKATSSAILSPYRHLLSPPLDSNRPSPSFTKNPAAPPSLSSESETRLRSLYGGGGSDNGLGSERSSNRGRETQGFKGSRTSAYSLQDSTASATRGSGELSSYNITLMSMTHTPIQDEESLQEVLVEEKRKVNKLRRKSLPAFSQPRPIMIAPRPVNPIVLDEPVLESNRPRTRSLDACRSLSLSLLPPPDLLVEDSLSSSIYYSPSLNNLQFRADTTLPNSSFSNRQSPTLDYLSFPTLQHEELLPSIDPIPLSDAMSDFLTFPFGTEEPTQLIDSRRPSLATESGLQSPTFSSCTPRFTSRFDPSMLDLARQEMEGDRAVFMNKEAGGAPRMVTMPTPLSGQSPIPIRKIRVEGPEEAEPELELQIEGEIIAVSEVVEKDQMGETKRPAGKLYGTSLLNMLDERKITNKSKQKQYVPGNDGRRTMMDWKVKEVVTEPEVADEGIPGGRFMPRAKSSLSIFGPDLLYQRDLERRRILEEQEMKELEQEDLDEAEAWKKSMIKEEAKSRKLKRKQNIKDTELKLTGELPKSTFEVPAPLIPIPHVIRPDNPTPKLSLPLGLMDLSDPITFPSSSPPDEVPAIFESSIYAQQSPNPNPSSPKNFPSRPAYSSQTSEERASYVRNAVMMGSITSAQGAAEMRMLGQTSGSSGTGSGKGSKTRMSYSSEVNIPPKVHLDLSASGLDQNMSVRERFELLTLGDSKDTPPVTEDEDDEDDEQPLGLKYSQLNLKDDEEDDVPLGIIHPQDEDIPLGLFVPPHQQQSHFQFLQQQQQQQQQQLFYHQQQQHLQQQQAAVQMHALMQHQQVALMYQQQQQQQEREKIRMSLGGGAGIENFFGGSEQGMENNGYIGDGNSVNGGGGGRVEQWRKGIS